jgi:hypothetical protein
MFGFLKMCVRVEVYLCIGAGWFPRVQAYYRHIRFVSLRNSNLIDTFDDRRVAALESTCCGARWNWDLRKRGLKRGRASKRT